MSINLDAIINKIGFEIVSQDIAKESDINKMIGVLANDGVYALWVFSNDKLKFKSIKFWQTLFSKDEIIEALSEYKIEEVKLFTAEKNSKIDQENDEKRKKQIFRDWQREVSEKFFHHLSENLNDLLFFREILERILIYARYHAKAMGEENEW